MNSQLTLIEKNPYAIETIENPSEELQLKAVKLLGESIEYIKNPSEKVQLEAIKENPYSIETIDNPSETVQLQAVTYFGDIIQYLPNASENVQSAAIQNNPYNIQYIENPNERIQMEAVIQCGLVIEYIKNPSKEIQLAAINENGAAIDLIEEVVVVKNNAVSMENTVVYLTESGLASTEMKQMLCKETVLITPHFFVNSSFINTIIVLQETDTTFEEEIFTTKCLFIQKDTYYIYSLTLENTEELLIHEVLDDTFYVNPESVIFTELKSITDFLKDIQTSILIEQGPFKTFEIKSKTNLYLNNTFWTNKLL